ncbi:hypothetical protein QYS49_24030 [Marivirga salinae]|uniref:Uncharacterized protein n=1 Tax=Marivirga salinarum TaxID=3059078 RepID=A0AA49J966_9BACT|nr:hypothetical protein [Marivirga sp. BDSF4-3]WKK74738.1 hypothetical protein QYS49_24030 [Marivirga sp. BDSF4-3]
MHFSNGMNLLDMMPLGYNSDYINSLFEALGKEGQDAYLYYQLPLDMFYPLFYTISFSLLIAYFLKKIKQFNSAFFFLCLIPIIAGITDYFENIGIITMLSTYPNMSETLMATTNVFTIIKSMTVSVTFITMIILFIIFGKNILNQRKTIGK